MNALRLAAPIVCALLLSACSGGGSGGGGGGSGFSSGFLIAGAGEQWYGASPAAWTQIFGLTGSYNARGVAYGNGRYVFTGDCGTNCSASASSSSDIDERNYTVSDFGANTVVYEVVFGNGIFVAVGISNSANVARAWVSSDGINWTVHSMVDHRASFRVAYGNGLFVADCNPSVAPFDDRICYSSDGVDWTPVILADAVFITDVAYGNGQFVALGANAAMSTLGTPYVWTSPDGINWSAPVDIGTPPGAFYDINAIAYGNGTWLAVGNNGGAGHTWRSANAVNWTLGDVVSQPLNDVIFANATFVAVGDLANVRSSSDGAAWINRDLPQGGGHLNAVIYKP